MMKHSKFCVIPLVLLSAGTARTEVPAGLSAAPAGANAVAVIDLQKLRSGGAKGTADPATITDLSAEFSSDVKTLAVAAMLNLDGFEPMWEMSVSTFDQGPTARELARVEKGYTDDVEGIPVVWSPRNIYFIPT